MKLKIDEYGYNRTYVKEWIRKKGADRYQEIASEFAVIANCPIFAVYWFMGELIGFDEWTIERMQSISKFYQYSEIISDNDIGHSVGLDREQFLKR